MFREGIPELIKWFHQNELKQDQIVSITVNEETVREDDKYCVFSIFYRALSVDPGAVPLTQFQKKVYEHKSWDDLTAEASNESLKRVISLAHTPSTDGQNNQVMFYA